MSTSLRWSALTFICLSVSALTVCFQVRSWAEDKASDEVKLFREEVYPVLKESCFRCHGSDKQKSGLRVDSRDHLLRGGQNGPAIVAGKPDESLLMKVLEYAGDIQMPPDAKLDEEKISAFKKWIEKDAPWPDDK